MMKRLIGDTLWPSKSVFPLCTNTRRTVRFLLLFVVCCFTTGCRQERPALDVKKLAVILRDFHLADAYAQYVPKADSFTQVLKNDDTLKRAYALVLARHQVRESDLRSSLKWYEARPDLLDSVYQLVLTDLAIQQARMNR